MTIKIYMYMLYTFDLPGSRVTIKIYMLHVYTFDLPGSGVTIKIYMLHVYTFDLPGSGVTIQIYMLYTFDIFFYLVITDTCVQYYEEKKLQRRHIMHIFVAVTFDTILAEYITHTSTTATCL